MVNVRVKIDILITDLPDEKNFGVLIAELYDKLNDHGKYDHLQTMVGKKYQMHVSADRAPD